MVNRCPGSPVLNDGVVRYIETAAYTGRGGQVTAAACLPLSLFTFMMAQRQHFIFYCHSQARHVLSTSWLRSSHVESHKSHVWPDLTRHQLYFEGIVKQVWTLKSTTIINGAASLRIFPED